MTKKLSIIALFLPLLGWSQSLENLLKSANLSEPTEVLMEFTEKEKSHFATGVEFTSTSACIPFYVLSETESGKSHVLGTCSGNLIHEEFSSLQSITSVAFQEDNSSTWVGKNDKEWVVFNLDLLRTKGWSPVRIPTSSFDSIFLLDEGHFLSIKGNRKWHNEIDGTGHVETNEVFFEGTEFHSYYGGFIVPMKENEALVYRYLQYTQYLFWDEATQDNLPDPNYHYLKPDGQFRAEQLIIPPNESSPYSVIKRNGKLGVYSFIEDAMVEEDLTSYYDIPYYGPLILTNEYVAFSGENWMRLPCQNPLKIEFDGLGEDMVTCSVTKKDGSVLRFVLPGGEIIE
jgi:hypothetical protein